MTHAVLIKNAPDYFAPNMPEHMQSLQQMLMITDVPSQPVDAELESLFSNIKQQRRLFNTAHIARLTIRDLLEAEITGDFFAALFPEPERVKLGIMELMVNAIEHGNLSISALEKKELILENQWTQEISKRLAWPEFTHRQVHIECKREADGTKIMIRDEGAGFDWKPYMSIDYVNNRAPNGRGILCARMISFDEMEYNAIGNQVTGWVRW